MHEYNQRAKTYSPLPHCGLLPSSTLYNSKKFLMTGIAVLKVDDLGRRPLFIGGVAGLATYLLPLSVYHNFVDASKIPLLYTQDAQNPIYSHTPQLSTRLLNNNPHNRTRAHLHPLRAETKLTARAPPHP